VIKENRPRRSSERYPGVQVVGHRDFNPGKACPCFDAKAEYSRADIDV